MGLGSGRLRRRDVLGLTRNGGWSVRTGGTGGSRRLAGEADAGCRLGCLRLGCALAAFTDAGFDFRPALGLELLEPFASGDGGGRLRWLSGGSGLGVGLGTGGVGAEAAGVVEVDTGSQGFALAPFALVADGLLLLLVLVPLVNVADDGPEDQQEGQEVLEPLHIAL